MNGLPTDFDPSFFVGQRLDQVCLGEYQAQLHYSNKLSVFIEGEFTLDSVRHPVTNAHILHTLLGAKVRDASRRGTGDIGLEIGSHRLQIHDSEGDYESYQITFEDRYIVV